MGVPKQEAERLKDIIEKKEQKINELEKTCSELKKSALGYEQTSE